MLNSCKSMNNTSSKLRSQVTPSDRDAVRRIVETTGFFRADEVDVAVELVDEALAKGETMVLDLDVKGAASIKRFYPEATTVFIKPPSLEILKERLEKRGTESAEVIAKRLTRAEMELAQAELFDCVIVNDEIDRAVAEVLRCIERGRKPVE